MKKALITGVTGQDGSYLAELLLQKNYEVHGIVRRSSSFNRGRVEHLIKNYDFPLRELRLHYGDMTDTPSLNKLLSEVEPDEVYNLAAQSHVAVSFETPEYTGQADAIGPLRILDSIKSLGLGSTCRFYQASTSELYGKVVETPQTESTPFCPRSPYAIAKLYAHWIAVNYREAFSMYACNGIMFNHESPRRGENFVTRKITLSLAKILEGSDKPVQLGNLNAKRDWGFAKDYVEGMWMTLQQDNPDDYVFATGEQYSVREFVEEAFSLCGINISWEGSDVNEKGIDKATGRTYVVVDPYYFRPTEVESLLGDSTKAREKLGWVHKTTFKELTKIMVEADLKRIGLDPTTIMIGT